jgi:hypothetical protein
MHAPLRQRALVRVNKLPVNETEAHIHVRQVGVAALSFQAAGHGQHVWRAAGNTVVGCIQRMILDCIMHTLLVTSQTELCRLLQLGVQGAPPEPDMRDPCV